MKTYIEQGIKLAKESITKCKERIKKEELKPNTDPVVIFFWSMNHQFYQGYLAAYEEIYAELYK